VLAEHLQEPDPLLTIVGKEPAGSHPAVAGLGRVPGQMGQEFLLAWAQKASSVTSEKSSCCCTSTWVPKRFVCICTFGRPAQRRRSSAMTSRKVFSAFRRLPSSPASSSSRHITRAIRSRVGECRVARNSAKSSWCPGMGSAQTTLIRVMRAQGNTVGLSDRGQGWRSGWPGGQCQCRTGCERG